MSRRDRSVKQLKSVLAKIDQANRETARRSAKSAPRLSISKQGAKISDVFKNGRLVRREVSPAMDKKFTKDVYTLKPGLPRKFDKLFTKGVDEKKWRLASGNRPYEHSAEGGPSGEKKIYHSVENVRMDRAVVGRAVRRGGWPTKYSKY